MPLQQANKVKGVADIVICVDVTASMTPCIDALKNNISVFIDGLQVSNGQQQAVDWRLRVLGYRDLFVDAEPWVNADAPMVSSVEEAQQQLANLVADGGGDEPESGLDALWCAIEQTPWRTNCTRVIALFSDASTHPGMHVSTIQAGAEGGDVSTVATSLAAANIYFFGWVPKVGDWETLSKVGKTRMEWKDGADGLRTVDFSETLSILSKTVSQISTDTCGQTVLA